MLLTAGVVLPSAQWLFLSGEESDGIDDDTGERVLMVLWVFCSLFVFGLNVFSMLVTNVTNAVMRTITE
jgi:hypothetical protein